MDLIEEYESNNYDDDPDHGNQNNAENEKQEKSSERVPVPKRIVRNPRLKFNPDRLCGERGIPILVNHFKSVKFKGKGHEKEDLNRLMSSLEHWCHRLFPSMKFEDCLRHIEKLGKKRPVQSCLRKIRLDQPILSNDFISEEQDDDDDVQRNQPQDESDLDAAFDSLFDKNSSQQIVCIPSPRTVAETSEASASALSEEQRKKMEHNKRLALEKRQARNAAKEKLMSLAEVTDTLSLDGVSLSKTGRENTEISSNFDGLMTLNKNDTLCCNRLEDDENYQLRDCKEVISLPFNSKDAEFVKNLANQELTLISKDNSASNKNNMPFSSLHLNQKPVSLENNETFTNLTTCTEHNDTTRTIHCKNSEEMELDELMDFIADEDENVTQEL